MHLTPANDPTPLSARIALETAWDANRVEAAKAEQRRARGVSLGGLTSGLYEPRTAEQIEASAKAALAAAEAFAATPRGRFFHAVHALRRAGYAWTAERCLAAFHRGFADEAMAPVHGEVAFALSELTTVPADSPAARFAREAAEALVDLAFTPAVEAA